MSAWTFIWLMVILKIPVGALLLLVRWAVQAVPEPEVDAEGHDDGGSPVPPEPRHPRPRLSRLPRRGPHHGSGAHPAPARTRSPLARARSVHH